jgi:hypothetical protein
MRADHHRLVADPDFSGLVSGELARRPVGSRTNPEVESPHLQPPAAAPGVEAMNRGLTMAAHRIRERDSRPWRPWPAVPSPLQGGLAPRDCHAADVVGSSDLEQRFLAARRTRQRLTLLVLRQSCTDSLKTFTPNFQAPLPQPPTGAGRSSDDA